MSFEDKELKLSVRQSWGCATARYCSGLVSDSLQVDVPLGMCVERWDGQTGRRLFCFQAHEQVITAMRPAPLGSWKDSLIMTASDAGELRLWDKKWNLLASLRTSLCPLRHMAWSSDGQHVLACSIGMNSLLIVVHVMQQQSSWEMDLTRQHHPHNAQSEQAQSDVLMSSFEMAEFLPDGKIIALVTQKNMSNDLVLISTDGTVSRKLPLTVRKDDGTTPSALMMTPCDNGLLAIAFDGRLVCTIKTESFTNLATFKVDSLPRCVLWDSGQLMCTTDGGVVQWFSPDGKLQSTVGGAPQDVAVQLLWADGAGQGCTENGAKLRHLWILYVSSLALVELAPVQKDTGAGAASLKVLQAIKLVRLAGCGLDISPDGQSIASGDLSGQVFVWVTEQQQEQVQPRQRAQVDGSVRCLVWWNNETLFVATLDGALLYWNLTTGSVPQKVDTVDGVSLLHICCSTESDKRLAVGRSDGRVAIYQHGSLPEKPLDLEKIFMAHPPKPKGDPAGPGLGKEAEVWSLCWSPDNTHLATCSEDRTVRVWSVPDWTLVKELSGNTMAVTCVDWQRLPSGSDLLACCSDDQTVRLYDGQSLLLLQVLQSQSIYGWYTLTYLAIQPFDKKDHLACVTQNGHFLLWNIETGEQRHWSKAHYGSIEGLDWSPVTGDLATVSADCSVKVFQVETLQPHNGSSEEQTCAML